MPAFLPAQHGRPASQSPSVKWAPSHLQAGLIQWEPECLLGGLALQQGGNKPTGGGDTDSSGLCLLLSHLTEPSEAFWRPSAPLGGPRKQPGGGAWPPCSHGLPQPSPIAILTARPWAAPHRPQCWGPWWSGVPWLPHSFESSAPFPPKQAGHGDPGHGRGRVRAWAESLRAPQHNGATAQVQPSLPIDRWENRVSRSRPESGAGKKQAPVSSASRAESAGSHWALLSGLTGLASRHLTLTPSIGLCQAPSGTHSLSLLSP